MDGAKQSLQAWERWWEQQRNQLVPSRRVEELERWASQTEKVNDNVVAKYNQKCEKYEALFTKLETLKEEKSDMLRMAKEAEAEIHGLRADYERQSRKLRALLQATRDVLCSVGYTFDHIKYTKNGGRFEGECIGLRSNRGHSVAVGPAALPLTQHVRGQARLPAPAASLLPTTQAPPMPVPAAPGRNVQFCLPGVAEHTPAPSPAVELGSLPSSIPSLVGGRRRRGDDVSSTSRASTQIAGLAQRRRADYS